MSSSSESQAIEVKNLRKYFRLPGATPRGTLNRLTHPVQRGGRRTLRVLDGITFDVQRGELFTVVGRNGSGKSTLLRILGSIYRADAGLVRIAGSMAPFIELGVGFQPQMSARQNIAVNGVMLGLDRREVRRRVDEVLAYAELEDFAEVQVKNFSTGMRMKLAFASMLQADPDIYLIDEILSVGDLAFRERCGGEFEALKKRGKTILMVTHRLGVVEQQADRAMLLESGRIAMLGDPAEVLSTYRAMPSAGPAAAIEGEQARASGEDRSAGPEPVRAPRATIEMLTIAGAEGSDRARIASGDALDLSIEVEASGWVRNPTLELSISGEDGTKIFVGRNGDPERLPVLKPGERFSASAVIENPLAPGRYRLECFLLHSTEARSRPVSAVRSLDFEVEGEPCAGFIELERTVALNPASTLELVR